MKHQQNTSTDADHMDLRLMWHVGLETIVKVGKREFYMSRSNKILDLVLNDISKEQGLRRTALILRMNSLIMCIYFLILLIFYFGMTNLFIPACAIPCFMAYLVLFYLTYLNKIRTAMIVQNVISMIFVTLFIYMFGWWCGVQHFIFVAVVIIYTTSTASARRKALQVTVLAVFRLLLNQYTNYFPPAVEVSAMAESYFQVVNTAVIFITIATCLHIYTKDTSEMEKQLEVYNKNNKLSNMIDLLTGLYNRQAISEYLEMAAEEKRGKQNGSICLAIGDVDNFRRINEQYGQACGDIMLRRAANQIREYMDGRGKAGRWSGVEFLLVFEDVLVQDAQQYLFDLQQKIRNTEFVYQDEIMHLSVTFGLQEYSHDESVDSNIMKAEKKLLQGKMEEKNSMEENHFMEEKHAMEDKHS